MLTAVFLHGHLGQKYGEKLMLEVDSVAAAIALLRANFPKFARDVIGHSYRVWVGKTNIDAPELINPVKGQDIHLVPVVEGAGGNWNGGSTAFGLILPKPDFENSKEYAVFRVIAGIVLIVIGFITYEFGGAALVAHGVGLVFGGVSDYITFSNIKKLGPALIEPISSGRKAGYLFNGAVNTAGQGNPVPVPYGRMMVGSQVISGSITEEDLR